jgi:hypothetical protein
MTPDMQGERPRRRPRGAGLAILLIIIGLLILLGNFGWLGWDTLVQIAYLWPVLLIAIGVDLLTRRRYQLAVWGGAIVVGALLVVYNVGGPGSGVIWGTPAGELHSVAHSLSGASAAEVNISTTVGTLRVSDMTSGGELIRGTVHTGRGETLTDNLNRRGDVAVLDLTSDQRRVPSIGGRERRTWDLQLTDAVPMDLSINTGVGQANLELQRLHLSSLQMEAGVGEVNATLPASGNYQASFKAGVGATHITIPSGMAARVTVQSGLGAVHVNGVFDRSGDSYVTPDFATAGNRVDLRVEGGLGEITVNH